MPQPLKPSRGPFNIFQFMKTPITNPAMLQVLCPFMVYCLISPVFEWWMYFDQSPGLSFIRISHKPGSSTYVLKCWLPSPQGLFHMALLTGNPLSLHSSDCFIWQSWVYTLGNTTKPMAWSTKALHSRWIHAGLKLYENRGHYTTRQKDSYGFGDQFNFKGVSNVSCADILSLQPAEAFQTSLEMCCAAGKHESLPTWKHPGSAPLSLFPYGLWL